MKADTSVIGLFWSGTAAEPGMENVSVAAEDIDALLDFAKQKSIELSIVGPEAPLVAVAELADSSVNFVVRVWTDTGDYWGVKFDATETIKNRFDAEGINIPYPQQDVHIVDYRKGGQQEG